MKTSQTPMAVPQAGFPISPWCKAANISRGTVYNLPPDLRPRSVKIGKRRIIIESPQDYLQRIAEMDAEQNHVEALEAA